MKNCSKQQRVLSIFFEKIQSQPKLSDLLSLTSPNYHVNLLIELIHQNYSNSNLCLGKLAKQTERSYSRLTHIFSSEMGYCPLEYLISLRIVSFNELCIKYPSTTISFLCKRCGFSSYMDFSYHIKSRFGVSPLIYKELLLYGTVGKIDNNNLI